MAVPFDSPEAVAGNPAVVADNRTAVVDSLAEVAGNLAVGAAGIPAGNRPVREPAVVVDTVAGKVFDRKTDSGLGNRADSEMDCWGCRS